MCNFVIFIEHQVRIAWFIRSGKHLKMSVNCIGRNRVQSKQKYRYSTFSCDALSLGKAYALNTKFYDKLTTSREPQTFFSKSKLIQVTDCINIEDISFICSDIPYYRLFSPPKVFLNIHWAHETLKVVI